MGYLCPTRPEIKNRSRRRSLFRGSKIQPAAINIYRDITKCLTCYGFFSITYRLSKKNIINA